MKQLLLILLLSFGFINSSNAESVYVEYRGNVSLNGFNCQYTQSSFVNRICYQQRNNYVLASLNGTYYQYCRVPSLITNGWLSSSSKGSFYNSNIKGRFDCRNDIYKPITAAEMSREAGKNLGKVIGDLFFNQNNSYQKNNSYQSTNSMQGKLLLDWGTTYNYYPASHLNGSDGMRCVITGIATFNCNNGVNYQPCGTSSFCGTDGTQYDERGDYTFTSFGVKCNHKTNTWTCR
jgi:hypothetical protein